MKTYAKFTALILTLGSAMPSMAKSLNEYRSDKTKIESATAESMGFSFEILKVLGMSRADLSAIPVPGGVRGKARHTNSSIFIKRRMEKGIRTLIDQERFGEQVILTPSSTMGVEEAAEAKRQSRLEVCHKVYPKALRDKDGKLKKEGTLDIIMDEIRELSLVKSERQEPVIVTDVAAVRAFLSGPTGSNGTVEARLGKLTGLEIVEGSIASLQFTQKSGEKISVSLSMLATFLSDEDDAFIAMMDCIYDEAHTKTVTAEETIKRYKELRGAVDGIRTVLDGERKEELDKIDIGLHNYNKDHYGPIDTYMGPRLQNARRANSVLKSLDPGSLQTLLFVMLKAQRNEIPSGSELSDLSKVTGEIINDAIKKNDQATVDQTLIDSNYFSGIQRQLSRLKETLEARNAMKIQVDNIIKNEIRGVKK